MLFIKLLTTCVLPISVIGFGINTSNVQFLHEAANNALPPASLLLHQVSIASSKVNIHSDFNLVDTYKQALIENPLVTKMLTGSTLAVCGDAIAQSRTGDKYDKRRGSSFAAFDSVYRAVQHFSFPIIVQQCQGQYIGTLVATIPGMATLINHIGLEKPEYFYGAIEQTLSSQLGIVPFFYYPVFYAVTAFVQGLDQDAAIQRARDTFIPLMKRNLLFWIPVQYIQFSYIDENLQIPFLSVAGLAWTFIISLFAGNAKPITPPKKTNDELIVVIRDDNSIRVIDIDEKTSKRDNLSVGVNEVMADKESVLR